MATPYLYQVRHALNDALIHACKDTIDDDDDDGYPIRPIVEMPGLEHRVTTTKLQNPAASNESCVLETSSNSVRLNVTFKQQQQQQQQQKQLLQDVAVSSSTSSNSKTSFKDATSCRRLIDQTILAKYMRFFQQRAESYHILRRTTTTATDHSKYSVSFLITSQHIQRFGRDAIVDSIVEFMSLVDKECSHVKISINARARLVASEFLKGF